MPTPTKKQIGAGGAISIILAAVFAAEGGYVNDLIILRRDKPTASMTHGKIIRRASVASNPAGVGRGKRQALSRLRTLKFASIWLLNRWLPQSCLRQDALQCPLPSATKGHGYVRPTQKQAFWRGVHHLREGAQRKGRVGPLHVALQSAAASNRAPSLYRANGRRMHTVRPPVPRLCLRLSSSGCRRQIARLGQRHRYYFHERIFGRSIQVPSSLRQLPQDHTCCGKVRV